MNFQFRFVTICAVFFWLDCSHTLAQSGSTVIQVGGIQGTSTIKVPNENSNVRTSLTNRQQRWESLLEQSYPNRLTGQMSCRDMLYLLEDIGLSVWLEPSAFDDDLTEEDQLSFTHPTASLYESLQGTLRERNAILVMLDERLSIVSLDDADAPEYFVTISYDVSAMPENIEYVIKDSIAVDDWDDTNGDGTIIINNFGNRRLLTVSQSYPIQRRIRKYLNGTLQLAGNSTTIAQADNAPSFAESKIIQLPSPRQIGGGFGSPGDSGGFGGGGIGGYGLGGGVF